jgi:TRAP-type C4-dicarboxylate transport system substrate-binding protein
MRKFINALLTGAVFGTLMLPAATASAQAVKEFKFSYVLTLETPLGLGAAKFAEIISQKSGGKMKVKLTREEAWAATSR